MEQIQYSILDLKNWANVQQLMVREKAASEEELKIKRSRCMKRHHAVSEGKFFLCAFTNGTYKLNAVPKDKRNYVDIYREDAVDAIYEYLNSDSPLPPACSWCNGNFIESWENGKLPVAKQIDKPRPYKKYE